MPKELFATHNDLPQEILERSPSHLPRPHWLKKSNYDDKVWIVTDNNPSSPKPAKKIRFDIVIFDPRRTSELCRLTDPQYAHLLDTTKRMLYYLRTGRYASFTAAKAHEEIARRSTDLIQWMIQNGIHRFSDLTKDDFDIYVRDSCYGAGSLLNYGSRLAECYRRLKEANEEIASDKRSNAKAFLNTTKLLEKAGIDPMIGRGDRNVCFELLRIAKVEDFYLYPRQLDRLSKGPPKPNKLAIHRLSLVLLPWYYLWLIRHDLPGDRIQFNPFDGVSVESVARRTGKEVGRTKTAPVRQTMELINHSLWWVLVYAPVLLDIRDEYDRVFAKGLHKANRIAHMKKIIGKISIPDGPGRPFPLDAGVKKARSGNLSFGEAELVFIPVACLIIIAAFSGRRHDEVLSIRATGAQNEDCIYRDEAGLWIETYIEKTVQDWVHTPCNEAVVIAVDILRRWSAPARKSSTDVRLFQFKQLTSNKNIPFKSTAAIARFVSFLPITPMPDGSHWQFKLHQFRRFFAIMYFWRYQYGDLASLSYHLRHFDPRVTQMYVTEIESGAIFRYINQEYTTTILTEAALGERNISGPFGERFKTTVRRLLGHFRRTVKVVSPDLISKTVERFVEKSGRRLKAFRWGYCACGTKPQQLRTARCLEGANKETLVSPDLSQSSFITCGGCPHHVTEAVFDKFWRTEIQLHQSVAADSNNPPMLRAASRERTNKLSHIHKRSLDSKPLGALDEEAY